MQDVEASWVPSLDYWIKEVVHTQWVSLSHRNETNHLPLHDGPGGHCAKGEKSDRETNTI